MQVLHRQESLGDEHLKRWLLTRKMYIKTIIKYQCLTLSVTNKKDWQYQEIRTEGMGACTHCRAKHKLMAIVLGKLLMICTKNCICPLAVTQKFQLLGMCQEKCVQVHKKSWMLTANSFKIAKEKNRNH